jgi:hypothetical protein
MAKKARKAKGQKTTPSKRKKGAGRRAAARSGGSKTGRRTAGAKTPRGKAARKGAAARGGKGAKRASGAKGAGATRARRAKSAKGARGAKGAARARGAGAKGARGVAAPKRVSAKAGGTGQESTLAQTPETGRTVSGPTNPMPTKRSTGTAGGAGGTRQAPGLERERKRLREVEETVPSPPSSLNMDRHGSAARSGRAAIRQAKREHTETSPAMTGGDVDADWEDAYAVGDEAPGGDNPTPDQDRVDDIGRALGVEYADNEELKASDKITERDRHRWELDPASAEDYPDHDED